MWDRKNPAKFKQNVIRAFETTGPGYGTGGDFLSGLTPSGSSARAG